MSAFPEIQAVELVFGFSLVPYPKYLLLATATGGGEELLVAVLAVNRATLLHKAHHGQGAAALSAVKLLWVPRLPHSDQERTPERERERE